MDPKTGIDLVTEASRRGWEAAAIAAVLLFLILLVRQTFKASEEREVRMAKRIDSLEEFVRSTLMQQVDNCQKALLETSAAVGKWQVAVEDLKTVLETRPCFWSPEKQADLLKRAELQLAHEHAHHRTGDRGSR